MEWWRCTPFLTRSVIDFEYVGTPSIAQETQLLQATRHHSPTPRALYMKETESEEETTPAGMQGEDA
jgi:hypothetical protein